MKRASDRDTLVHTERGTHLHIYKQTYTHRERETVPESGGSGSRIASE